MLDERDRKQLIYLVMMVIPVKFSCILVVELVLQSGSEIGLVDEFDGLTLCRRI